MVKLVDGGLYVLKGEKEPIILNKINGKFLFHKGYCEKNADGITSVGCRVREITENDVERQIWRDHNKHEFEIGDIVVKLTETWNSKVGHELGKVVELNGKKVTVEFEHEAIKVWGCDLLIITPSKWSKYYKHLVPNQNK